MNRLYKHQKTVAFALILFMVSCNKQEMPALNQDMSLFAFIISDNNLDDHTDYVEHDIVQGLKGCPAGTELFLYIDRRDKVPSLRQLFLLESGQVGVKTIAEYQEQCSTSPSVFKNILQTMKEYSSGRQYGLIYWSHGSGWMPGFVKGSATRALGADGIYSMDVDDLHNVLSQTKVPLFTILDACFMGSVEVAYSLRGSTDYLIASPGETLGIGFPYHLMLPELIKGTEESLKRSLDRYLEYCYTDYYGDGTISGMATLIDCSQMDALATSFRNIMKQAPSTIPVPDSIQVYDCSTPHIYYDLWEYVNSIATDPVALEVFGNQLERTVIHRVTTPYLFTQTSGKDSLIAVDSFSGLSTYIPGSSESYDNLYTLTGWYKDCYGTEKE